MITAGAKQQWQTSVPAAEQCALCRAVFSCCGALAGPTAAGHVLAIGVRMCAEQLCTVVVRLDDDVFERVVASNR